MTIRIDDPEADQLIHDLTQRTGETATEVVVKALREHLIREEERSRSVERIVLAAMMIGQHCAALPILDARHPDELLGYDEQGLPG